MNIDINKNTECDKYITDTKNNEIITEQTNNIQNIVSSSELLHMIKYNHNLIKILPDNKKTLDFCFVAVKYNEKSIKYIPVEYQKEKYYIIFIKLNNLSFNYIPIEHKTYKLCLMAVKLCPSLIKNIPENCKIYEIYYLAMNWGNLIDIVPNKYKNYELCLKAIDHLCKLDKIPEKYINFDICLLFAYKQYIKAYNGFKKYYASTHIEQIKKEFVNNFSLIPKKFVTSITIILCTNDFINDELKDIILQNIKLDDNNYKKILKIITNSQIRFKNKYYS